MSKSGDLLPPYSSNRFFFSIQAQITLDINCLLSIVNCSWWTMMHAVNPKIAASSSNKHRISAIASQAKGASLAVAWYHQWGQSLPLVPPAHTSSLAYQFATTAKFFNCRCCQEPLPVPFQWRAPRWSPRATPMRSTGWIDVDFTAKSLNRGCLSEATELLCFFSCECRKEEKREGRIHLLEKKGSGNKATIILFLDFFSFKKFWKIWWNLKANLENSPKF